MDRVVPQGRVEQHRQMPDDEVDRPEGQRDERMRENVIAALRTVYDPEIPINIYDLGLIYALELKRLRQIPKSKGGDFHLTQATRAGRRFARALVTSTFEGQSSFTEAFRLLGVNKVDTLRRFGAEVGLRI